MRSQALAAWAASVVVVLALNVVWPLPGQAESWPWATGLMAFPVAGGLLLAKRPGNPIGRILALVGVAAAAIFTLSWYAVTYPDPGCRDTPRPQAAPPRWRSSRV